MCMCSRGAGAYIRQLIFRRKSNPKQEHQFVLNDKNNHRAFSNNDFDESSWPSNHFTWWSGQVSTWFSTRYSDLSKVSPITQSQYKSALIVFPLFCNVISRLKDLLRLRLSECGWSDQVKLLCRNVVKEEGGKVNVEKIVQQVTPKARSLVPDTVKKELLRKIKTILSSQEGADLWD